jgi:hypothetical protein
MDLSALLDPQCFPPHYTNLPAELLPKYTTIVYTLFRLAQAPPVFLFGVDTCLALRDTFVVSLSLIPPYELVSLPSAQWYVHMFFLSFKLITLTTRCKLTNWAM